MSAARGVTLFQLLGGILAIGLIMSVVTRVYGSGRDGAPSLSVGKMKRIYRAIALYRSEYGDGHIWRGLPDRAYVYETYMGFSREFFVSPCAGVRGFANRTAGVSYAYTWVPQRTELFETLGSEMPILIDADCAQVLNDGKPKLGLAILMNGSAISVEKPGNPNSLSWWVGGPTPPVSR